LRLLLDTHVVLWQLEDGPSLGTGATAAIATAEDLRISVVSYIEIGVKTAIGKLRVRDDFHERVLASGLQLLGLTPEHGLALATLPLHHRDPFDRLLVVQAQLEGLTLVTADARMTAYDVARIDAAT
jgi:PIN domain nuclease of toxin-antitoxin system